MNLYIQVNSFDKHTALIPFKSGIVCKYENAFICQEIFILKNQFFLFRFKETF